MTFFSWWRSLVHYVNYTSRGTRRTRQPGKARKPIRKRHWLSLELLEDRFAPSAGTMSIPMPTLPTGNPAGTIYPDQQFTATVQLQSTPGSSTLELYDIGISYDRNVFQTPADYSGVSTPTGTSGAGGHGFTSLIGTVFSPYDAANHLDALTATNYDVNGSYAMSGNATLNLLNILYTVQPAATAGTYVINLRQDTLVNSGRWLPTDAIDGNSVNWTLTPSPSDTAGVTDPNDLTLTVGTIGSTAVTSNSVTSSTNASVFGQSVTFTATIAGTDGSAHPTVGGVEFLDGATVLGFANVTASGTNGIATFTTSALSLGNHSITAVFGGDANFASSTSGGFAQTVNQASTTTTGSPSYPEVPFGSYTGYLVLTANVGAASPGSGTTTGTVTFKEGSNTLGTSTFSYGQGTYTVTETQLAAGTHTITANYSGDTNFLPSTDTSGDLNAIIDKAVTDTTLTAAPTTQAYGQPVSFTATLTVNSTYAYPTVGAGVVDPGVLSFAGGTVTLTDGLDGPTKGTGTVSGGTLAPISVSSLSGGTHTIWAVYSGDTNFTQTNGTVGFAVVTITGGTQTTTTTVSSSTSASVFGQSVTFTATVTPQTGGTPTGTVTFSDGSTSLGTGMLNSGTPDVATFTTSSLSAATHPITAVYGSDTTNFSTSTSGTYQQTVNAASTSATVSSSTSASVYGQSVTFTATVYVTSPGMGTPTGTVTFKDGGTSIGTGGLVGSTNPTATFATSTLSAATHPITAVYGSDTTNFSTSTSGTYQQTVNAASTSATVSSSTSASVYGQSVTFTATVSVTSPGVGTPTGTVTFKDGGTSIGTGGLVGSTNPTATFTTSTLSAATHTITAIYSSDTTNFSTSTSDTFQQTVNAASTTTTVTSSGTPATVNTTVTFTATVYVTSPGAGTPTGTVTFNDGGTSIGTGTLSGNPGVATFSDSGLSIGVALYSALHTITAVYGSDTNFGGSTSAAVTQEIDPDTLFVTSFTQTATGFVVTFNRSLKLVSGSGPTATPILHIYNDNAGSLGPISLTVVRNGSHIELDSSLVVDTPSDGPANSRATFILTGQTGVGETPPSGLLPGGTYTVTLNSSATGFQDTSSQLLDGNATGNTQGVNYVTSFTVSNPPSSSLTVSLPDFALGHACGYAKQRHHRNDAQCDRRWSSAAPAQQCGQFRHRDIRKS